MTHTPLHVLQRRAQVIADTTGLPRWVVHTSLGWRIEDTPCSPSVPQFRFDPTNQLDRLREDMRGERAPDT
jgi:hypothetical protein